MTAFSYGFGIAISLAMAIAIGNAWARDHRRGVWTPSMVAALVGTALVVGTAIGWSLDHYFAFIAASASGRM